MTLVCDRCHKPILGIGDGHPHERVGFYRVSPGAYWDKMANEGESVICAGCAWADPRWLAYYG